MGEIDKEVFKEEILKDLKQLYFLDREIKHLENDLLETENRLRRGCGLGGFRSDGTTSDITGNTVVAIMEYSDEIDRKIRELYRKKTVCERYIQTLDDPVLRTVLRMRCLDFYSWVKIAQLIKAKGESTPRMMVENFFKNN